MQSARKRKSSKSVNHGDSQDIMSVKKEKKTHATINQPTNQHKSRLTLVLRRECASHAPCAHDDDDDDDGDVYATRTGFVRGHTGFRHAHRNKSRNASQLVGSRPLRALAT